MASRPEPSGRRPSTPADGPAATTAAPRGAVPDDGLPDDGVPDDGVPDDGLPGTMPGAAPRAGGFGAPTEPRPGGPAAEPRAERGSTSRTRGSPARTVRDAGPACRPLLLVCALGVERFALARGDRRGAAGAVAVLRTGMGPKAAERAVTEALRDDPDLRDAAVLATGFCAGLLPGMLPGDVVVADEAVLGPARIGCTAPGVLAGALAEPLARRGRTVRTGPLAGADRVIRGADRARLAAAGALAADMESATVLRAALALGARPVAAVRVVVDTPEYELLRVGTLRTGATAFGVLRSVIPAFLEWHRTTALSWR